MQRVKAHELRGREEKNLVEELTKYRVTNFNSCFHMSNYFYCLERIGSTQSKQGQCCSPGQISPYQGKLHSSYGDNMRLINCCCVMQHTRKAIAKVLTVINEKRISAARETFKNKKYTPYDLRLKKTRAYRKKLTQHELGIRTAKQQKKEANFRPRKFALAA